MTHKPSICHRMRPSRHIARGLLLDGVLGLLLGLESAQAFSPADLLRLRPPLQPEAGSGLNIPAPQTPPVVVSPRTDADVNTQGQGPQQNPRTIHVLGFRVLGSTQFGEAELAALLNDHVGRDLTFDQLQTLTVRLGEHYHRHGFEAATAYIPVQKVRAGIVDLAVNEGTVARISVDTPNPTDAATLRSYLDLKTGTPLRLDTLGQHLLALSQLPGMQSRFTLSPGQEPGSTDVVLHAQRGEPSLIGQVELNNVALLPWSAGQVDATLNWRHAGTLLGTGLTTRLTALGKNSLRSQVTVTHQSPKQRWGLDLAYLDYTLDPASTLMSLDFPNEVEHGRAVLAAADVSTTLIHRPEQISKFQARLEHRSYHNQFGFIVDTRYVDRFTLGWHEQRYRLNAQQGFEAEITAGQSGDVGAFTLLSSRWALAVSTGIGWQVHARAEAQWASQALPPSEQLRLGGPMAVRAYDSSDARVDTGFVTGTELRRVGQTVDGFIFGDIGWGIVNQAPIDLAHWLNRESLGVGLDMHPRPKTHLAVQASWQTIHTPPRLWLSLKQAF